jgi:taurine dioxygenase
MSAFEIRPTAGSLGAELHGLDLREPLDPETAAAIDQALCDHLVIFFPEQKLSPEQHLAFSRSLGEVFTDHPPYLPTLDGHPEVVVLSGQAGGRADLWHTDITINPRPPKGSILYMKESPPYGGDTMWANLYLSYDALSEPMKRYLGELSAVHDISGGGGALRTLRSDDTVPTGTELEKSYAKKAATVVLPTAEHPIVRTHPVTQRKCLFVNPTFTSHIKGVSSAESSAILDFLYAHMVQPEFICRRNWSQGDVGMWDNRCTMHYAIADYGDANRVIHRTTLVGDVPV